MSRITLKQRLADPRPLLTPGVFDAFTSLIAQQAGFEALYLSGASIAYTRLGQPDVGLVTASEVAETISHIADRVDLPLIVDADTGWGNALNVQRTVRTFERAGASMLQLEDQTFPKRCGHLSGKQVIPVAEMCGKLRAAVDARASADTLIMARTDAIAVEGWDAAVDRAEAYLECGVDALFVEAPGTMDQIAEAGRRFGSRIPLLANMVEGGATPISSADALGTLGYRIVIFPGGTARAAGYALQAYFSSLMAHGSTAPMRDRMLDLQGINRLIGTSDLLDTGARYS